VQGWLDDPEISAFLKDSASERSSLSPVKEQATPSAFAPVAP
jgi:hypothetical protein